MFIETRLRLRSIVSCYWLTSRRCVEGSRTEASNDIIWTRFFISHTTTTVIPVGLWVWQWECRLVKDLGFNKNSNSFLVDETFIVSLFASPRARGCFHNDHWQRRQWQFVHSEIWRMLFLVQRNTNYCNFGLTPRIITDCVCLCFHISFAFLDSCLEFPLRWFLGWFSCLAILRRQQTIKRCTASPLHPRCNLQGTRCKIIMYWSENSSFQSYMFLFIDLLICTCEMLLSAGLKFAILHPRQCSLSWLKHLYCTTFVLAAFVKAFVLLCLPVNLALLDVFRSHAFNGSAMRFGTLEGQFMTNPQRIASVRFRQGKRC